MKKIVSVLFVLQSCIGWGDVFATKKRIAGNYYLMEDGAGGYLIGYKIDDVYIGRNPSNSNVVAYAITDSIMVMKVQFYDSTLKYYVLGMRKDTGVAKDEEIFIDTIANSDYETSWLKRRNLNFKIID